MDTQIKLEPEVQNRCYSNNGKSFLGAYNDNNTMSRIEIEDDDECKQYWYQVMK